MNTETVASVPDPEVPAPARKPLSDEHRAITHKFSIAGHEGHITAGLYDDGTPGEIFVRMSYEGTTVAGLLSVFSTAVSLSLQHGVPLVELVKRFRDVRYAPEGYTRNPQIPFARSITDYVVRWLGFKFLPEDDQVKAGLIPRKPDIAPKETVRPGSFARGTGGTELAKEVGAPSCHYCGNAMQDGALFYRCPNCGAEKIKNS